MAYKEKNKILTIRPNKDKFYSVRASNDLKKLKAWKNWAEKNHKDQKFIIVDENAIIKKERPQDLEYFKMRQKRNLEERYSVYGSI